MRTGSKLVQVGLVLALPMTAVFAVVGLAVSGAAAPDVLLDPGPLVRWGLPVTTAVRELAAAVTLGALVLTACVLPRPAARPAGRTGAAGGAGRPAIGTRPAPGVDGRAWTAAPVLAAIAGSVWTLVAVLHLVLTYASASGRPIGGADFGTELSFFVSQIALGRTLLAMTVIAALTAVLALAVTSVSSAAWLAGLAAVALVLQAQTGHAAGSVNHELATSALWLHLMGAAVWIGALAALALLLGRLGADLPAAIARYSAIAGWAFAAVGISGVVNGAIRLGGWDGLTTRYGWLLLAKVALFGTLGLLGWTHRRAVMPQLAGSDRARGLFWRLLAVEMLVMGAVSGVAVALGASEPPVPEVPVGDRTPAEIVTGHLLPPAPAATQWIVQWRWDILLASGCAAALVVYLRWVHRLRRRGDAWPVGRTTTWVVGVLLLAWVTSGGPAVYGHVLFSAHMIEHMLLVMVVPIFLALAAPVTLGLRALPVRADGSRGPREWVLTLVHSRVGRFVSNPLVAAANFAGSMIVFYYTGLFELSLRSSVGHLAMVAHFTLAGYLFVNAVAGIDPGPRRPGYPQRMLLLFATMGFHAFFGVTLTISQTLLVPDWFGLLGRDWGPSAIVDQQTGGGIAWGIGELPMLALAIAVAVAWTRADERTARRLDRAADRDGDADLTAYNDMLARLRDRPDGG